MKTTWWAVTLVVLTTILTSAAQVLYKLGAAQLPIILTNWPLILGLFLYAVGAVMLISAFKGGDVSVLFPIIATSYIWVALLSWHYFSEALTLFKLLGISAIVLGVMLVGIGSKQQSAVDYLEAP